MQPWCRARAWVAKDLEFDSARRINLFETTIRIVGGLLSAFQLSEDPLFLVRAEELVQKMLPAFEPPDTCERNLWVVLWYGGVNGHVRADDAHGSAFWPPNACEHWVTGNIMRVASSCSTIWKMLASPRAPVSVCLPEQEPAYAGCQWPTWEAAACAAPASYVVFCLLCQCLRCCFTMHTGSPRMHSLQCM